jgi:hypothetical protein
MNNAIIENLDSAIIFQYIKTLEENKDIFIVYKKLIKQLAEREQYWRKAGNNIIADEFKNVLEV